jgi:hypothetical protein
MTSQEIGSTIVDRLEVMAAKGGRISWDEAVMEATDGEPGIIHSLLHDDVVRIEKMRKYFL